MLRTRTLEYVHIDDICELFGLNMREFSFTDEKENGSFFYLCCNDHWIQDTIECIEDMEGTRYETKYRNTLKLQNYVRNEMKQDGIEIYIAW